MEKLERIVRKIINFFGGISAILILIMMLMTVWDIIGRRLFSSSVPGVYELSGIGLVLITFLALGLPQIEGENVGVTIIYDRLKPIVQKVLDVFIAILCIALFSMVAIQTFAYAQRMAASSQITPVLHISYAPILYTSVVGILALIVAFIWDLAQAIHNLKGDNADVRIK